MLAAAAAAAAECSSSSNRKQQQEAAAALLEKSASHTVAASLRFVIAYTPTAAGAPAEVMLTSLLCLQLHLP